MVQRQRLFINDIHSNTIYLAVGGTVKMGMAVFKSNRIYSIVLGDYIICADFKCNVLPDNYCFLGIQDEIKQAPINDGKKLEETRLVPEMVFKQAYNAILNKAKPLYLANEVQKIFSLWEELVNRHYPMPSPYPSEVFIQSCIERIHDENKKIGERHTYRNFAISFAAALTDVYDIQIFFCSDRKKCANSKYIYNEKENQKKTSYRRV